MTRIYITRSNSYLSLPVCLELISIPPGWSYDQSNCFSQLV
jgi:hypothetical protein